MSRLPLLRPKSLLASLTVLALLCVACGLDPNVQKVKFLQSGNKYFSAGKYREALIMYRNATQKDPKFGEAYYRAAIAELKLDDFAHGLLSMRRAVELLPPGDLRRKAVVRLLDLYVVYMESVTVEKELLLHGDHLADELLRLDPKSYDGHRMKARLAIFRAREKSGILPEEAAQEFRTAIAEFRAADSSRPYQPGVVVPLARSLALTGQLPEAERILKALLDKSTTAVDGYSELHRLYLAERRFADAERILELGVANNPEHHPFLLELAAHYQRLGKHDEMVRALDQLKQHASEKAAIYEIVGEFYRRAGEPETAIRQFEEGMRAYPGRKAAYQILIVDALIAQHKRSESIRLNETILKDNPNNLDALVRRSTFSLEDGQYPKAATDLEKLLRLAPGHVLIHYNLGRAYEGTGRQEQARFQYTEAIRRNPSYVPARVALARLEINAEEWGKAVRSSEDILELDKKNPTARLVQAAGLRGLKKMAEARQVLEALLAEYPNSDEALVQLGVLEDLEGKHKQAAAAYWKSYRVNPANLKGLLAIAQWQRAHDQGDRALELLASEANKRPDFNDLRLCYADEAARLGKLDLAFHEYESLLPKVKNDPRATADLYLRLGEYHRRAGDLPAALRYLEKGKELWTDNSAILHDLGLTYDMLGRRDDARREYEAGLKINGDNGVVLNNLAYYIAERGGDLDQALTYAQRARQKLPHMPEILDTIGLIYLKKNLGDSAIDIFQDAVRQRPTDPTFRFHLGMALYQRGQKARARQELRTALGNNPSPEDAGKIQQLLQKTGT